MTSQGTAHGRFTRALKQRNLSAAEMSLHELGNVSLEDALSYLVLLAEQKPEKLERAGVRWHGRLETEATFLESQLALAALASLSAGSETPSKCCEVCSGGCARPRCRTPAWGVRRSAGEASARRLHRPSSRSRLRRAGL